MKFYVEKASDICFGTVMEFQGLEECCNFLMDNWNRDWDNGEFLLPELIISRPKDYKSRKYIPPEATVGCDYIVLVYNSWIE